MLLGAHTSIAGGIDKAIERGDSLHCTAIQIFTKNSNQWKGKTLSPDEIERYHDLKKRSEINIVIAHDSYLVNLASGSDELLLLSVLRRQRELSIKEAIAILHLDTIRTREIIMKMAGKGYLEKSGMKKGMIFRLSGSLCKRLGESINYIRGKGVDELRYPELILEYIKEPFSCPFMKLPLRLHYLPLR